MGIKSPYRLCHMPDFIVVWEFISRTAESSNDFMLVHAGTFVNPKEENK